MLSFHVGWKANPEAPSTLGFWGREEDKKLTTGRVQAAKEKKKRKNKKVAIGRAYAAREKR